MKQFIALVKVSFRGIISSAGSRGAKSGSRKRSTDPVAGFLLLLTALIVGYSTMYCNMIIGSLCKAGCPELLFAIWALASIILPAFIGLMGASSFIFGGKDNTILLPAPVRPIILLAAKTSSLYFEMLFMTALIMIPAAVTFALHAEMTAGMVVMFAIGLLFIPLISCAIDMIFGELVAFFGSRSKHKALVSNTISIAFIAAIMVWGFSQSSDASETLDIEGILQKISWCRPAMLFADAAGKGNVVSFLIFVAGASACALVTAFIISRFYIGIISRSSGVSVSHDYRIGHFRGRGQLKALYLKEMKKVIGTSSYFLNCVIGAIMLLIVSVVIAVRADEVRQMMAEDPDAAAMVFIMGMVGTLFCVSMVPTTAASISIEGKNLWILKGAPVPSSVIFKAKVLASITFTGVLTTISTVIFAVAIRMNIVQFILYLAVGLIGCVLMALFGLMMNLKFPKLDAVNEIYIYKQSASVGFMVLVGFVISILAAAVLLVLTYTVNVYAASLITAAIMLILIFACVHNLEHKGKTAFERL